MHSAAAVLILYSFLSVVAGTTTAWLHPKSITVFGSLVSIWGWTQWHSEQASKTFDLKDTERQHSFLLWRASLIQEFCGVYAWGAAVVILIQSSHFVVSVKATRRVNPELVVYRLVFLLVLTVYIPNKTPPSIWTPPFPHHHATSLTN